MKKVAVIGAGAAGLAALRILSRHAKDLSFTAFEQSDRVGGTWIHNDKYKPTSMYDNLKTNLPKEVMGFPDMPFPDDIKESFVGHKDVLNYLESYAREFDLKRHIKFRHTVLEVDIEDSTAKVEDCWKVTVRDDVTGQKASQLFDFILCCNGHYTVPYIPELEGRDMYTGELVHSHYYRTPSTYQNKTVFVLGAGPSGVDVALDIAKAAKKIFLGHNRPRIESKLPSKIEEVVGIKGFNGSDIILLDGREVQADVVMLATGYRYTFPFLTDRCQPVISNEHVHCYKYLVDLKHPSLYYVGLNKSILPFCQFYLQCEFAVANILGVVLPLSLQEMSREHERHYKSYVLDQGKREKDFHYLRGVQWAYNSELARLCGADPLPPYIAKLYYHVLERRHSFLPRYKEAVYKVDGPDSFLIVQEFDQNEDC